MSGSADFQTFRYVRRNVKTGQARIAERGFLSRREFLGELHDWNAQQPENWRYEPVQPVLPVGYTRDLHTVSDRGEVAPC